MAFHRGRIDLLEAHLKHDPSLLRAPWFGQGEIFPLSWGFKLGEGLHVTPVSGSTLSAWPWDLDELDVAQ